MKADSIKRLTSPERPPRGAPLLDALTVITQQQGPITMAEKARLEHLIAADVEVLTCDLTHQHRRASEKAAAHKEALQQRLETTRAQAQQAAEDEQTARAVPRSLFKAILFGLCASVAALGEFYLTNATLPSALDVPRTSLLGIALSLGPTAAFIFMERPLEHLQQSAWRKTYVAFLWLVLAANVLTVYLLADVRHEIARVTRDLLQGKPDIVFHELVLHHAMLAVSIILAINGALFLLWAPQYGRPWLHWRQARRQGRRFQKQLVALLKQQAHWTAEAATQQAQLDHNRPALVARHYKELCHLKLARLQVKDRTSMETVEDYVGLHAARLAISRN